MGTVQIWNKISLKVMKDSVVNVTKIYYLKVKINKLIINWLSFIFIHLTLFGYS